MTATSTAALAAVSSPAVSAASSLAASGTSGGGGAAGGAAAAAAAGTADAGATAGTPPPLPPPAGSGVGSPSRWTPLPHPHPRLVAPSPLPSPPTGVFWAPYGPHGVEVVTVAPPSPWTPCVGAQSRAPCGCRRCCVAVVTKVTGDVNVPAGQVTFFVSAAEVCPAMLPPEWQAVGAGGRVRVRALKGHVRVAGAGFLSPGWHPMLCVTLSAGAGESDGFCAALGPVGWVLPFRRLYLPSGAGG